MSDTARPTVETCIEGALRCLRHDGYRPDYVKRAILWLANAKAALPVVVPTPAPPEMCFARYALPSGSRLVCELPVGHRENHLAHGPGISVQWPASPSEGTPARKCATCGGMMSPKDWCLCPDEPEHE